MCQYLCTLGSVKQFSTTSTTWQTAITNMTSLRLMKSFTSSQFIESVRNFLSFNMMSSRTEELKRGWQSTTSRHLILYHTDTQISEEFVWIWSSYSRPIWRLWKYRQYWYTGFYFFGHNNYWLLMWFYCWLAKSIEEEIWRKISGKPSLPYQSKNCLTAVPPYHHIIINNNNNNNNNQQQLHK